MITWEVNSPDTAFGTKRVTPSNVEKHRASFCGMLDDGVVLASVSVAVSTGAVSTVQSAALSDNRKSASWFVHASAAAEQFIATVTVTTNDGQTLQFIVTYIIG